MTIRIFGILFGGAAWLVVLVGTPKLGELEAGGFWNHGICGPWGCGPPLTALIGWHSFWVLLATPVVFVSTFLWPRKQLQCLGALLVIVGLLAAAAVGLYETMTWLPQFSSGRPTYFFQRWMFSIVTMTDIPVVSVTITGLLINLSARFRRTQSSWNLNTPARAT